MNTSSIKFTECPHCQLTTTFGWRVDAGSWADSGCAGSQRDLFLHDLLTATDFPRNPTVVFASRDIFDAWLAELGARALGKTHGSLLMVHGVEIVPDPAFRDGVIRYYRNGDLLFCSSGWTV